MFKKVADFIQNLKKTKDFQQQEKRIQALEYYVAQIEEVSKLAQFIKEQQEKQREHEESLKPPENKKNWYIQ